MSATSSYPQGATCPTRRMNPRNH